MSQFTDLAGNVIKVYVNDNLGYAEFSIGGEFITAWNIGDIGADAVVEDFKSIWLTAQEAVTARNATPYDNTNAQYEALSQ